MKERENCHEVDIDMPGTGRASKFRLGDRGDLSLRRRHQGPGRFQRSRAGGDGASDLCGKGRGGGAAAGSLRRWWTIRRWHPGILDQRQDGTIDPRRSHDRLHDEIVNEELTISGTATIWTGNRIWADGYDVQ